MDRGRSFQAPPPSPAESDAAANRRLRRAVVNDTRRKIERALRVADAAQELATAVQAVLMAAEAKQVDLERLGFAALSASLAKYQQAVRG